jgi:hypothetical protein
MNTNYNVQKSNSFNIEHNKLKGVVKISSFPSAISLNGNGESPNLSDQMSSLTEETDKTDLESETFVSDETTSSKLDLEGELLYSIYEGELEKVKTILNLGLINFSKNFRFDGYSGSLLHIAIKYKKSNIVKELIYVYNFNVDSPDKEGFYPIHIATSQGNIEVLEILLGLSEINLNIRDQFGNAPIHISLRNKHYHVMKMLLEKGADVNFKKSNGNTLLQEVVKISNEEAFSLLMEMHQNETIDIFFNLKSKTNIFKDLKI